MLGDPVNIGLAARATSLETAYRNLLEQLEQALSPADGGDVTGAYQEYADAHGEGFGASKAYDRVTRAAGHLADELALAIEQREVSSAADEATARYLEQVAEAWPQLHTESPQLESLVAVASGMTTIAWLYGFRSDGQQVAKLAKDLTTLAVNHYQSTLDLNRVYTTSYSTIWPPRHHGERHGMAASRISLSRQRRLNCGPTGAPVTMW